MSEKLYGGYLASVQNVREAKLELARQAAQCVERVMLDFDKSSGALTIQALQNCNNAEGRPFPGV